MDNLQPFDEIHNLKNKMLDNAANGGLINGEDVYDELLDILITSYLAGDAHAREQLKLLGAPSLDKMETSVYKEIAGKTMRHRIREYAEIGDIEAIIKVAETETNRVFNEASYDAASEYDGVIYKTWNTMLDNKVRETHDYLEQTKIPFDEYFYTFDGDKALYPGGFETAQNNINCRCFVDFSKP